MPVATVMNRLNKYRWNVERAVTEPPHAAWKTTRHERYKSIL
jgi:hypothetical protein